MARVFGGPAHGRELSVEGVTFNVAVYDGLPAFVTVADEASSVAPTVKVVQYELVGGCFYAPTKAPFWAPEDFRLKWYDAGPGMVLCRVFVSTALGEAEARVTLTTWLVASHQEEARVIVTEAAQRAVDEGAFTASPDAILRAAHALTRPKVRAGDLMLATALLKRYASLKSEL